MPARGDHVVLLGLRRVRPVLEIVIQTADGLGGLVGNFARGQRRACRTQRFHLHAGQVAEVFDQRTLPAKSNGFPKRVFQASITRLRSPKVGITNLNGVVRCACAAAGKVQDRDEKDGNVGKSHVAPPQNGVFQAESSPGTR